MKDNTAPNQEWVQAVRGLELVPGVFRQFCWKCQTRLTITDRTLRYKTDLVCDDCRPPIQSCNELSMAFSPTSKERT